MTTTKPVNAGETSLALPDKGRRRFIRNSAGLTLAFSFAGLGGCENRNQAQHPPSTANPEQVFTANIWVNISTRGRIRIYSPADELGQGSMTALPLIFAEEFDANWDDVDIEFSPPDEALYGNPKFMQGLYTISSFSVIGYYQLLRQSGAQARRLLLDNVAGHWKVPVRELSTQPSVILHPASGRRMSYAEVAGFATLPETLPEIGGDELKSPDQFRLIGHSVPRRDVPGKVSGTSPYAINASPPGLLHAVAVRSPVMGGRPVSVEDQAARQVKGVIDVIAREHSVCIVAEKYYNALQARKLLKVAWSYPGSVGSFDSDMALQAHIELVNNPEMKGDVYYEKGSALATISQAGQVVSGQYQSDYVYHAQMEPLNATVSVMDEGRRVEAWVGTQASAATLRVIARVTGVPAERIILHRAMVGGGFGRRSIQEMDFVEDAAWLSKHYGRPVKVIWTREDDVAQGWFKPMTAHLLRASLDGDGRISAWHHRVAVQEPLATAEPVIFEKIGGEPVVSMPGTEQHSYAIPQQLAEHIDVQPGIRTYTVLGVGWTPNLFAVEGFMDELAAATGKDPLEFRLQHLDTSQRARAVLTRAAEMADWGKTLPAGRAQGIAFADYHHSLLAGVAEISMEDGRIRVHKFSAVIDPGVAVQPDNIRDQITGSIVFGMGGALTERITLRQGLVQESNFHDYLVPKMADAPDIEVEILAGGSEPTGVGQTGAVLVAPAIAGAFYRLTGKRLRHMPFTPDRVKALLA